MKVAVFSTKAYDECFFIQANRNFNHQLDFFPAHLNETTIQLAFGYPVVCIFVNDRLDRQAIELLSRQGLCLIALRCAGFNNVDLQAACEFNVKVVRVPAYSPYAVAEHTVALMLTLNRKIHRAYNRVRESNFSLEGLLGFDLHQRTVGIVGTGKIGMVVAQILTGFGCNILAYDPYPNAQCKELGVRYVFLPELFSTCDIITLHCPLAPETHHLINAEAIDMMKSGVMLINTSRGAVVDTRAVIDGLKSKKIGYLGMDVYEEEGDLFFEDLSCEVIQDDVFSRLLTFPNVIITGHQAFFTEDALRNIAQTTLQNISEIEKDGQCLHEVALNPPFHSVCPSP